MTDNIPSFRENTKIMSKLKADHSQFEFGQVISQPESLPGCVQVARYNNAKTNTSRTVVVKKYNLADISRDTADITRHIQHEVTAMRQFDHQNILTCLTSLVRGSEVWVVSPLAEYGSVRDLISRKVFSPGPGLPELFICLVVRDVCQGLDYLHHQGVVHRALRASHILLKGNAAVVSGLRFSTELQATGEGRPNLYSFPLHGVSSNLAWLAPEILQQNLLGYNEASDIYSLAITICQMANGVVPFADMPATLMMVEKLQGTEPSLENKEEFSGHFHQLVSVCCSQQQQVRPTARDILGHPVIKQLKKTNTSLGSILAARDRITFSKVKQVEEQEESPLSQPVKSWDF